jgi:hypothetical protein
MLSSQPLTWKEAFGKTQQKTAVKLLACLEQLLAGGYRPEPSPASGMQAME